MGIYSGVFPASILEAIQSNPDVSGVYADGQGFIAVEHEQTVVHPAFVISKEVDHTNHVSPRHALSRALSHFLGIRATPGIVKQTRATWNLARMAYRKAPTGANATIFAYNSTAGAGVDIYVIDTGIYIGHNEFGGRAKWGNSVQAYLGVKTDDNGHGTHLAAIAAGSRYGVAKGANVVAVKVASDSSGAFASDIVAGIHWTIGAVKKSKRPSVISLSLGSGVNGALDAAAEKAVKKAIHFVAAAGNDGLDAAAHSPGRSDKVITVGATDSKDSKASYSNSGSAVDIWVGGTAVTSAWLGRPDATASLSGTSMAAPHIAGLVAYVISMYGNQAPAEMKKWLAIAATNGTITKLAGDNNNRLAYNCWSETCYTFPKPPPPPVNSTTSANSTTTVLSSMTSLTSVTASSSITSAPPANNPPPA
jgi:cerevisin